MNLTRSKRKMVVGLLVLTGGGIFHSQAQSNNASTQPQVQEVNMAGKTEVPEDTVANGQGKKLDEVVVTALGIKSNAKSLGYAASTISADEVSKAASSSAMSGLTGKVAGVNISSAGGAGTSQKVIIRGISSFSNNQPLYVVDGVPMLNNMFGNVSITAATDFGNQANDINPDDIESITVLKGASATALYGSRASSGVIMITTKRGQQNQKLSVAYNGSFMAVDVQRVPLTQDVFGQGWPTWNAAENGSWGPKLDGRIHKWGAWSNVGNTPPVGFVVQEKPFSYIKNNIRDFYETGFETNNNISVSGGNSLASFLMSYGNAYTNGILPTNVDKYVRNTLLFRGDLKYKKFGASFDVSYIAKNISAAAGGQGSSPARGIYQDLLQVPVDIPIKSFSDYNGTQSLDNFFSWYITNPVWTLHNSGNNYKDDRVFGKVELSYEIIKGLRAVARLSGDYTNANIEYYNNIATYAEGTWSNSASSYRKTVQTGRYLYNDIRYAQTELITFLNADYEIWKNNISFNAVAGYNYNQYKNTNFQNSIANLVIPGFYNITNSTALPTPTQTSSMRRLMAAFGQVNLGFRDYWFVNLSLRNDWSSTLPINANSYFYWGINTSLVITDMLHKEFNIDLKGVDFLKLRLAYGETGKDASPYRTNPYYPNTSIPLTTGGINIISPVNGVPMVTIGNTAANNQLQPEFTTEYEAGLEGKFLKSRLGFDIAYYDRTTKGQIISASVAPESGYTTYSRNIGKINNKGVELAVYGSPIKTKDWEWQLGLTFTKNYSKVVALWDNNGIPVNRYVIYGVTSGIDFVAQVGQPLGVYQVPQAYKTPDGKTIVNATDGTPITDPINKKTVGSSNPDFLIGLTTKLSWKGLSLSATFDYRQGGYFFSQTASTLAFSGNSPITVYNNRNPFIYPNSVTSSTATNATGSVYTENYLPIYGSNMISYYGASGTPILENFVLSRTYIKLRELVLSYRLPQKWYSKAHIQLIEVSLIGRNLFLFTPATNTFVDPEATSLGNDITSEFGEYQAGPSTRSYGASVKITF